MNSPSMPKSIPQPPSRTPSPPPRVPSPPPPPPLSPVNTALPPDTNVSSLSISPLFEAPSFYSDLNSKITLFDINQPVSTATDVHERPHQSRTNEQIPSTPPIRQITDYEATNIAIPSAASIYNRSTSSSIVSLGLSTTPRGSVSNKIAPAPVPPSPVSPKHPLSTTFQPISNTRYNPGRSPKPKSRTHHSRTPGKPHQQQPSFLEKSTIIDLECSTQPDTTNKNTPLLSTPSKATSITKSGSNVFRRFLTSGSSTEKTTMSSSSTLLYPPTSDDEHPMSPVSSGNDDDDYRPLTSSSSKYHQTPL